MAVLTASATRFDGVPLTRRPAAVLMSPCAPSGIDGGDDPGAMHAGESRHRGVETQARVRALAMLPVAAVLAAAACAPAGDPRTNVPDGSPVNGAGTGSNP